MWFRRYCPDKHSLTFWTCCDLDLQPSNPIFQQDTLAYDAVLSNQVWLQTDQQFINHNRNGHILIIKVLAVAVTLTLQTANSSLCMSQTDQQFRRYNRNSHNLIISPRCDLDIEHSEPIFCMTLWLMMLHNRTRFGDKMFSGSEDIVRTNIH